MNRRDFFKRTTPAVAIVAIAPLSLFLKKDEHAKHFSLGKDGRVTVEGEHVTVENAYIEGGLIVHASKGVTVTGCTIEPDRSQYGILIQPS